MVNKIQKKFSLKLLMVLLLGFWAGGGARAADGSFNFSYSGRLTEANGRPVQGPVSLSLSFYQVATGGSPVLTVTDGLAAVPLQEGMFQVSLALSGHDFHLAFPSVLEPVYVEVTDLSNRPSAPYERQLVAMVPYAAKVPVDDKMVTFNDQGRATLAVSGTASNGKLLSADGAGGLAWIDPPSTTVTNVGGVTAANIASGASAANNATDSATASSLVKRDTNGGFAADNIAIAPTSASREGLIIKGAAGQTASLQEWQNSTGDVLASIDQSGTLKFKDGDGTNNYVALKAPTTLGSDVTYVLPATPVAGNYLQTDASGNLSWHSPSGAGDMTQSVYDTDSNNTVDRSEDGQKFITGSSWAGSAPASLTTLSADLNVAATSAAVVSTVGYPTQGMLVIGNEVLSYTGTTPTSFTGLTRGLFGTSDALHSSGASINNLLFSTAASATAPKLVVTGQGRVGLGTLKPLSMFETLSTSNIVGQIVRGSSGQSFDLQQWQSNDGTALAAVDKDGAILTKGNGSNYAKIAASQAMAGNLTFTLPATAGSSGDVMTTNGAGVLSWTTPVSAAATATLTNKTIDAQNNTVTNLDDAAIKSSAAISRSKLASGTADHVLINNGSGVMSSEAQLAVSRGGTGAGSLTSNGVILGNGTSALTATAAGSNSTVLTVPSGGGAPTFATIVDANISATAAVARTKIASGSNDHVVINSGAGVLSSEAQLALSRGGTGANLSATGGSGQYLKQTTVGGNISVGAIAAADYPEMVGADGTSAGTRGAVPAPVASDNVKFLRGDGTWATPASTGVSTARTISAGTGLSGGGDLSADRTLSLAIAANGSLGGFKATTGKITLDGGGAITNITADSVSGTVAVANGGTGATSLTSNGVLLGNGTGAVDVTSAGAAYNILRVPSTGGAPAFGAIDVSQSGAVTGILGVANGGSGAATATANKVFASPDGASGAPTFRALVADDYPAMVGDSGAGGSKGAVPAPTTGATAAGKFLKADGSWTVPMAIGSTVTSATSGSVLFADNAGKLAQNNGGLFWDDSIGALGIGNASPSAKLQVTGQIVSSMPAGLAPSGTTQTIDFSTGNVQALSLASASGNVTLTLSNAVAGGSYAIKITQGATPRSLTWPGSVKWPGGVSLALSTGNGAIDLVSLFYDGTNFFAIGGNNFQ